MSEFLGTATYSPDDNKLRFYPYSRLSSENYERIRTTGFIWAPKQELFVAPTWSPNREDLLLEWCGEIDDDDKSLVDRAEERAERFDGYQEKRAKEADQTHNAVSRLAENIPFGQPILIGHHSERRARKNAERIENGLRKAVKLWDTASYWESRAIGAIQHAKYKELPAVRARRIKKIEAENRGVLRDKAKMEKTLTFYSDPASKTISRSDGSLLVLAMLFSWELGLSTDNQSRLKNGEITLDEAIAMKVKGLIAGIARCNRWIAHYENRLAYEKAMLNEQGASDLLKPKARPTQLPMLNYRALEGLDAARGREVRHYEQVEMTKAEYAAIGTDYKGSRIVNGSHRVRIAVVRQKLVTVFITDSKAHPIPTEPAKEPEPAAMPRQTFRMRERVEIDRPSSQSPTPSQYEVAKEQLKAGVKVLAGPQLFPTPAHLARRVVEIASIDDSHQVLEPSAGTGALLDAINESASPAGIVAVELNHSLAEHLTSRYAHTAHAERVNHKVLQGDFLSLTVAELGTFDRIVMNPPFDNAADIAHIKHAKRFLKPGGQLVAICANGPRQRRELMQIVTHWEDLPEGSFRSAGTNVNAALVVLT